MPQKRTTHEFLESIKQFSWVADYPRFCEVMDFEPNDYSYQKYVEFRELVSCLARFDVKSLEKILEAGKIDWSSNFDW